MSNRIRESWRKVVSGWKFHRRISILKKESNHWWYIYTH